MRNNKNINKLKKQYWRVVTLGLICWVTVQTLMTIQSFFQMVQSFFEIFH